MIDLRSDTVTRPTASMREAMTRAEVMVKPQARLVTHLDVSDDDIRHVVASIKDYFSRSAA